MGKNHTNQSTEKSTNEQPKKPNSEMTDAERKKIKQQNKAKANPEQAERNKEINDAKRERRKESGSVKQLG
jgi:hypothetical protein